MDENDHPLAMFRRERGLTQEALARQIGVTAMAVSRWERRQQAPRRKLWPQIVAVTGIRPADLVAAVTEAAE